MWLIKWWIWSNDNFKNHLIIIWWTLDVHLYDMENYSNISSSIPIVDTRLIGEILDGGIVYQILVDEHGWRSYQWIVLWFWSSIL